jgi:glutamate/tyrosine decarboxylase-like PLP-dependent enzyme
VTARGADYGAALDRAVGHAREWLDSLTERAVAPRATADELRAGPDALLPDGPVEAAETVDRLARLVEPGLMAIPSGRFFGWVMGGTLPAALGADWLVSSWDQNAAMRAATPGVVAAEEVAAGWLLDLLGLPTGSDVGFVTGATMANFTCLAAARQHLLTAAGWDLDRDGVRGSPRLHVLVGAERHETVDLALRYLGLGAPTLVPADEQGRIRVEALGDALGQCDGPTLVCLQAGNLHSGAFDPFGPAIKLAHAAGAWVHVDGAFGLWAAASPGLRALVAGCEEADSWGTDAHKTLNVPYDCGIAVVRDARAIRGALGVRSSYLMSADQDGPADPLETVPELGRRARGVPVWAALCSLGRSGVAGLVDRLAAHARAIAEGISGIEGAQVLNDVVFTQVCVSFGTDERTRAVTRNLIDDGVVWMSGSRWHDRDVLRVSVSNWGTDDDDVAVSVRAVRRAAAAEDSSSTPSS